MRNVFSFFITNKRATLFLAVLWTMFLFFACFIPGNDVPNVKIFQIDKLVHITLFAGCSFLWGMYFFKYGRKFKLFAWDFGGSVCLGILVELIQSTNWVKGRSGDVWDVVADTMGAALGIFIIKYFSEPRKEKEVKSER